MIAIIYKYTAPNGKIYIGQTVNESKRREVFLDVTKKYAGGKIDYARKKFGPENFQYEILYQKEFYTYKLAKKVLNRKERYYIKKFNSFKEGLNGNNGGSNYSIDNICITLKAKIKRFLKK